MRNWFCKKYNVCSECKVHFEPITGYEAKWGNLCATHRGPVMALAARRQAVIDWAGSRWEKLEPQMLEETQKERVAQVFMHLT